MPGFYGRASVQSDLRNFRRTGKVVAAVLTLSDGDATAIPYANAYAWPAPVQSGIGGQGRAWTAGRITLWRIGESEGPKADDSVTLPINGVSTSVRVNGVTARLNADEADGFAIYDIDYGTSSVM